jgi:hypothetical protein
MSLCDDLLKYENGTGRRVRDCAIHKPWALSEDREQDIFIELELRTRRPSPNSIPIPSPLNLNDFTLYVLPISV